MYHYEEYRYYNDSGHAIYYYNDSFRRFFICYLI